MILTLKCRSLGYGWTNDSSIALESLLPCVWGGLRSVEIERKRAAEHLPRGESIARERLWVGGQPVIGWRFVTPSTSRAYAGFFMSDALFTKLGPYENGSVGLLLRSLREHGKIELRFDDKLVDNKLGVAGVRLSRAAEVFRALDDALGSSSSEAARLAGRSTVARLCDLDDAARAWHELRRAGALEGIRLEIEAEREKTA